MSREITGHYLMMQPAFVTLWLLQTERQEKAFDDGFKDH
jgi:hypothetical protein